MLTDSLSAPAQVVS